MVDAIFIITAVAYFIFNLQIIPIFSMWRRRKELLCKARSPGLACLHGLAQLVYTEIIWIQELMRQRGGGALPQSLCIWISCVTLPLIVVPAALRASRVVIITSRDQRSKKLQALKSTSQLHALAFNLVIHLLLGVLAELSRTMNFWKHDYSYLFQPWQIFGAMSLLSTIPTFKSCVELLAAKDALRVGRELVRCQICVYVTVLPYYVLVALNDYNVITTDTRIQFLLVATVIYWNLETFVLSRPRWALKKRPRRKMGVLDQKQLLAVSPSMVADRSGGSPGGSPTGVSAWKSSLKVMKHPALNVLYAKYVEANLCWESYSYLQDATTYEEALAAGDYKDDFIKFSKIVHDYILHGSSLEINVSSKARKQVLAYSKRPAYTELTPEAKRKIFDPCIIEVSCMLDSNLITGFQKTTGFKEVMFGMNRDLAATAVASFRKTSLEVAGEELRSVEELL